MVCKRSKRSKKATPNRKKLLDGLHASESGEHAMEFLMILTFGVMPMIAAVWLMQDVLQEYVTFGQVFISSPFF
ncbi:MAG: hypothetical protein NXI15_10840 [Gammaproteobacteria bacterium]|jgi:hypothetical protein|nr:hypothetical protein [Gammaproteobacteria bacterium]